MKTKEQKLGWLKDQQWRADCAERSLVAAKRQRVSEYDERLRKIRDFRDALFVKGTDEQQQELFDPDDLLSPDLNKLLASPLQGLD